MWYKGGITLLTWSVQCESVGNQPSWKDKYSFICGSIRAKNNSAERHWQVNLPTWPITEWGVCDVTLSVKVSYFHTMTVFYKQTSDCGLTQILRVCVQCGVWCCSILNSEMFRHKSRSEVTKNKDWYIKYRGQDSIWWTGNWITASFKGRWRIYNLMINRF